MLAEGKLSRESKSVSQSVSSLDRDDEDTATLRQARDVLKVECEVKIFFIPHQVVFVMMLRSPLFHLEKNHLFKTLCVYCSLFECKYNQL